MKNSIFSKLSPKEPKFFPMLEELASVLSEVSHLITECVRTYNYDRSVDYFKQIKDLERKGDRVSNTIFEELNTTFITPFDREDIHDLANVLDDVIDFINSCAKRIVMYHPKKMPEPATTLGELLISAADYIGSSVKELDTLQKNSDKIKDNCSKLHEIEHTADDVYEHFIMGLFENPTDPLEIIKLKEIMHSLEQATDAAERVAKIIKTIIVKYS